MDRRLAMAETKLETVEVVADILFVYWRYVYEVYGFVIRREGRESITRRS
jgi:hypothetical protein